MESEIESQKQPESTSVFHWGFIVKEKQFTVPTLIKQLEGKRIVKVVSGGFFYMALSSNGEVYAWGSAKHNQFGLDGEIIEIPTHIPIKQKIMNISAGNWHSMLVDQDGICYAAGHNKNGACGVGSFDHINQYTKCALESKIKMVSCGDRFSLMLDCQGSIYSCGHHSFHGHKYDENICKPKCLNIQGVKFKHIAAGFTHSVCVSTEGSAYSWGNSTFYQLGHGNKNHQQQPKKIVKLEGIKIVNSSCSRGEKNGHSMAIAQSGQVYTWGAGYKGKLGHANEWTHADSADEPYPRVIKHLDVKAIKTGGGGIHSTLIGSDGGIYSFGCGSDGRLGHIESNDHRYLYRQGYPRKIQTLQAWDTIDLCSSYYQNICLATKKKEAK